MALSELAVFPDGPVHELVLRPFEKRMDDAKRSVLHLMLRALAEHTGYSMDDLKAMLAQDGEWPIVEKEWRGKVRRVRKPTMDLTVDESKQLIAAVESICANEGVSWGKVGNYQDEGYPA
jgi:hypothetical protein